MSTGEGRLALKLWGHGHNGRSDVVLFERKNRKDV